MALRKYVPKAYRDDRALVTVETKGFRFNVTAHNLMGLHNVHYMQVHVDSKERLIVFELMVGTKKQADCLKLRTGGVLTGKGLVSENDWIKEVARQDVAYRKFEVRRYSDHEVQGWSIQLMPAFEKSVVPSQIARLDSDGKGIYRYRGGSNGNEVVYIGKGSIRDRFQQEPQRRGWGVSRIEYSIVNDDQTAYEWEAYWIRRFQDENNGRIPRFNQVGGRSSS